MAPKACTLILPNRRARPGGRPLFGRPDRIPPLGKKSVGCPISGAFLDCWLPARSASETGVHHVQGGDLLDRARRSCRHGSIDGRQGHSLWRLRDRAVGMPADYDPIGFRIHATASSFHVGLIAVDRGMIEAEGSLKAWSQEPGQVAAFEFPVKDMSLAELIGLMERLNLVVMAKVVPCEKVRICEDN
jgi:hypothetical protein